MIPKGSEYAIICNKDAENLLFNFQTATLLPSAEKIDSIDVKTAEYYFNELDFLFLNKKKSAYKILSLYYSFFSEVFDSKETESNIEKYVTMAEKIIANQLSSCTCQNLAKEMNISEVYLRKLFVRFRGISPTKYLLEARMKKARLYIIEGYTISECALKVGYSDIYQFSRSYKKHYGYSPSDTTKISV